MKKIILGLIMMAAIMLSNFVVAQENLESDKSREDLMYEAAFSNLMDGYVSEEKMDSAIIEMKKIARLYPKNIGARIAIGDALSYKTYSVLDRIKNEALLEETRDSLKFSYIDLLNESLLFFQEAHRMDDKNLSIIDWMSVLYLRAGKNKESEEMRRLYNSLRMDNKR